MSGENHKMYEYVVKIYLRDKTSKKYKIEIEGTKSKEGVIKFILDQLSYKQFLIIEGEAISINFIESIKVLDIDELEVKVCEGINESLKFNVDEMKKLDLNKEELINEIKSRMSTIGMNPKWNGCNPDI